MLEKWGHSDLNGFDIRIMVKGKVRTCKGTQKFAQSSSCFGNLLSKRPKHDEDFFKICVFLRKSEL